MVKPPRFSRSTSCSSSWKWLTSGGMRTSGDGRSEIPAAGRLVQTHADARASPRFLPEPATRRQLTVATASISTRKSSPAESDSTGVTVLARPRQRANTSRFFERVRIGNVGTRRDDVGCPYPCGFEAGLDILACPLDLRPHVTLANKIALLIDGQLPADIHSLAATLDPDDHGRRMICTSCPDEGRSRPMRDGRPVRVRPFDILS